MISMCICTFPWSRPLCSPDYYLPRVSPNLPAHGLKVWTIMLSQCISKFIWSRPRSTSLSSLDLGLEVHLPTRSIKAYKYFCKFSWSWFGKTAELGSREPTINSPQYLSQHWNAICETERMWLDEQRVKVWGYDRVPGCEKPYKVCGSMNCRQECVRTNRRCVDLSRLGKSVWDQEVLHNEMMSIYARVSQYILPITQSISVLPESL